MFEKLRNSKTLRDLRQAKQTKQYAPFSLAGREKWAEVVDIYDGDSIKVILKFRGGIDQWTVRMNGYDSPEMRPPRADPNRDQIIEKAKAAKAALENIIGGNPVYLKIAEFDKYGRLLADVYVGDVHINKWMIDEGHGYPYDGGKKKTTVEILANESDDAKKSNDAETDNADTEITIVDVISTEGVTTDESST